MEIRQTAEYKKWIQNLKDVSAKARIDIRVKRLEEGNPGITRNLGGGVSELKFTFGPGYRVYYSQTGKTIILLLIGGNKSTQKTDINLARKLLENI